MAGVCIFIDGQEEVMRGLHVSLEFDIGPCGRKRRLCVPLGPFSEQEGALTPMGQSVTITDSQKFKIGPVTAVDAKGNPASLGGPLTFASSDTSLLTVTDNGDGSAEASAVGPLGNAQVTVSDTVETAVVDVTVIGGAEAGLSVALGTPEEQ